MRRRPSRDNLEPMAGRKDPKKDDTEAGKATQGPSFEEESLKLFEEGVRVARSAQARLDEAEKRVEELLGIDEDGEPRVRPFGDGRSAAPPAGDD